MISNVKVAAVQMSCSDDREENIAKAERMVRQAASDGANVILLPELFELPYFCQEKNYDYYYLADKTEENPAVKRFMQVAKETGTVIPVSFYEKHGNAFFNTIAMIDCDGSLMGIYRKSHIPDDHFYQEKFYFTPGDTGFKVWNTKFGCIGVGICWDQWFPEAARAMTLLGAEMLFYPTAIGSEPTLDIDSKPHWQRCMQGHAAANIMPVHASNRIGTETEKNASGSSSMTFYGSSFITDETGAIVEEADRETESVLTHTFDLDAIAQRRREWGVFRDRRPEMYQILTTHGR